MSNLHLGDIVNYVLLLKDRPVDPTKQWRGQVKRILVGYILVESLEPGYEGQTEYITISQVKSVENPWEQVASHIVTHGDENTYRRSLK